MNLYNIEQEFLAIQAEIEENYGEITPEIEERIAINNENFKDKVKSYTDIIKSIKADLEAIKIEKARLMEFQRNKERTLDSISKILTAAILQFGDTTKSGGKYIDFGTGKVSCSSTTSVSVNEDILDRTAEQTLNYIKWCQQSNIPAENITIDNIMDFINSQTDVENLNEVEIPQLSKKDIELIDFDFNIKSNITNLLNSEEGRNLIYALMHYNAKSKGTVSKTAIKEEANSEEHYLPPYAEILNNQSLRIK